MVADAEKYGEADKERKNAIEAANRADSVVNDTEKVRRSYVTSKTKLTVFSYGRRLRNSRTDWTKPRLRRSKRRLQDFANSLLRASPVKELRPLPRLRKRQMSFRTPA
jgi:molecular chaperone DnaK (HSP70)